MPTEDIFLWLPDIVEKIQGKHGVEPEEVEEVLSGHPKLLRGPKGNRPGEDIHYALGVTDAGRYLTIVFIRKLDERILIVTARDMTSKERRRHGRK